MREERNALLRGMPIRLPNGKDGIFMKKSGDLAWVFEGTITKPSTGLYTVAHNAITAIPEEAQ